jgi:hypothetical protein
VSTLHIRGHSLQDIAADLSREIKFIALCLSFFAGCTTTAAAFKTPLAVLLHFSGTLERYLESDLFSNT